MATILIIFPKLKLTKLANFVQFIRMLMICLDDREEGLSPLRPTPLWLRHCMLTKH